MKKAIIIGLSILMILSIGCNGNTDCGIEYRFKIYSINGEYLDTCKTTNMGRITFWDCENYERINSDKVLWKETEINTCYIPIDTQ